MSSPVSDGPGFRHFRAIGIDQGKSFTEWAKARKLPEFALTFLASWAMGCYSTTLLNKQTMELFPVWARIMASLAWMIVSFFATTGTIGMFLDRRYMKLLKADIAAMKREIAIREEILAQQSTELQELTKKSGVSLH